MALFAFHDSLERQIHLVQQCWVFHRDPLEAERTIVSRFRRDSFRVTMIEQFSVWCFGRVELLGKMFRLPRSARGDSRPGDLLLRQWHRASSECFPNWILTSANLSRFNRHPRRIRRGPVEPIPQT